MISKSRIDKLIPVLRKKVKRTMKMRLPGFPAPYYASFLLRDINWFNTWSSNGSVYRRRSDHTRNIYNDIRVGSYRYDQVTHGGLLDNDDELESTSFIKAPIDDRDHYGLRVALWRLTDVKYREAVADYANRKASSISTVDQFKDYRSFTPLPSIRSVHYGRPEKINEDKWVKFCKHISHWAASLKGVSTSWVEYDASQVTRIFVSSEDRIIVQHHQIFSLTAVIRRLTKEGSVLEQVIPINVGSQKELPDTRAIKKILLEKYAQLKKLSKAKRVHSFSGPVLLYPVPAGVLIHEAVGHRLEGSRMLSTTEGQTFKGHMNQKVIPECLSVKDDPRIRTFDGIKCIGAYDFDDEGTEATEANLVEGGVLKEFLGTRAQHVKKDFKLNGHARSKGFQRPISRMGVTVIEGGEQYSLDELRHKLLETIQEQGKPFGMIIYETSGGETETSSVDFQAFTGEISYASLIYPNGKEVVVRGVDFVGTPLAALSNIVAVSKEREIQNGFCQAESGFLPITTISPAILLKNLELQSKSEELVTQFILPRPKR